jgi:hypothetical protein
LRPQTARQPVHALAAFSGGSFGPGLLAQGPGKQAKQRIRGAHLVTYAWNGAARLHTNTRTGVRAGRPAMLTVWLPPIVYSRLGSSRGLGRTCLSDKPTLSLSHSCCLELQTKISTITKCCSQIQSSRVLLLSVGIVQKGFESGVREQIVVSRARWPRSGLAVDHAVGRRRCHRWD